MKNCPDCAGMCRECGWDRPADMLDDEGVCDICREIEERQLLDESHDYERYQNACDGWKVAG